MLAASFGMTFFLKTPRKETDSRMIYLRITVDGIPKETSTKHRWDASRWDQKKERATGNKEDARTTNFFLEMLQIKIQQYRNELMYSGQAITSQKLMDYVWGRSASRATIMEEFQLHNDQLLALVERGEYAIGTHVRFEIAKKHLKEYLRYKYNVDDMEFRELNFTFVKDYEFYLKTVKKISHALQDGTIL